MSGNGHGQTAKEFDAPLRHHDRYISSTRDRLARGRARHIHGTRRGDDSQSRSPVEETAPTPIEDARRQSQRQGQGQRGRNTWDSTHSSSTPTDDLYPLIQFEEATIEDSQRRLLVPVDASQQQQQQPRNDGANTEPAHTWTKPSAYPLRQRDDNMTGSLESKQKEHTAEHSTAGKNDLNRALELIETQRIELQNLRDENARLQSYASDVQTLKEEEEEENARLKRQVNELTKACSFSNLRSKQLSQYFESIAHSLLHILCTIGIAGKIPRQVLPDTIHHNELDDKQIENVLREIGLVDGKFHTHVKSAIWRMREIEKQRVQNRNKGVDQAGSASASGSGPA